MRENAISMRIGRGGVCGCLLTMSVLSGRTALGGSDTTFYVVRHAETEAPTNDPHLTEQGLRRAEELRRFSVTFRSRLCTQPGGCGPSRPRCPPPPRRGSKSLPMSRLT